ncbi:MAG: hypothetical protein FWG63_00955 [Defluviitaleaceae bacterium]|nr:hypothetical protein [Defluviitaleaceae bacterium]
MLSKVYVRLLVFLFLSFLFFLSACAVTPEAEPLDEPNEIAYYAPNSGSSDILTNHIVIDDELSDRTLEILDIMDGFISFSDNDILPFIYEFPTVPNMGIIQMFPAHSRVFESEYNRLSMILPLDSSFEIAVDNFKTLMYLSGFSRVYDMSALLDPSISPVGYDIVFEKDNIFVSIEQEGEFSPCGNPENGIYPTAYLRLAKIPDWITNKGFEVCENDIDRDLFFESFNFVYPFRYQSLFEYENFASNVGKTGIYEGVDFSLQLLINQPPIHIAIHHGSNGIRFLYELDFEHYKKFLYDLRILMSINDFHRVYEINATDERVLVAGGLDYYFNANLLFTNGTWDLLVEEVSLSDTNTKQFAITLYRFGLGTTGQW